MKPFAPNSVAIATRDDLCVPGDANRSSGWKRSWRDAAWVFALSRLAIIGLTAMSTAIFPLFSQTASPSSAEHLHGWYHFDAIVYTVIAHQGYTSQRYTAFFPLWPLLLHIVGAPFGGTQDSYYVAGLVLSNTCFFFALVLFHRLISVEFDPTIARVGLIFLAFYPYALFFFAGYTESLFLLLCLSLFLLLRQQQMRYWWLAGVLGFLATLTRSTGIILVIPFLMLALQRYWLGQQFARAAWGQKAQSLASACLVPVGLLTYMLYLGITKGNPLLFSTAEGIWHRHLAVPGIEFLWTIGLVLHQHLFFQLLDIIFSLLPLIILLLGRKRLPLHYLLFAVAIAFFSLSFPAYNSEPLASMPRYLMVIFPVFIICALWSKRGHFSRWYLLVALPLFALFILFFITHRWVA
jgi:hypothetical protein